MGSYILSTHEEQQQMLSAIGVKIGNIFGSRFEKKAQVTGGVILILLGVKILLEHLGVL